VVTGMLAAPIGLSRTYMAGAILTLAGLLFFLLVSLPHYQKNLGEG
jgi:hypothetical protein